MLPGVLVVEDEATIAKNIRSYLARAGFDVSVARDGAGALVEFERVRPDVVVLDYNLPDIDGLELLARLQERDPAVKTVMITGEGGVEVAVRAMKAGVRDYLAKPLVLGELKMLLERIAGEERIEGVLSYYRRRAAEGGELAALIGESPPIKALKAKILQLANSDTIAREGPLAPVLITGETGTGKQLVARALHLAGPRREQPFIEVNCAAIPTHLLESELFGYEKGAFTDARERKRGLVETAHGGTLFLDEVGDMELAAQAKLLKALEDRSVRRLGGLRDMAVDVRVISATNHDLQQCVRDGTFRSDLFYRLRVVHLEVPPLRDRGDDVERLASAFLAEFAPRYGKPRLRFGDAAANALRCHDWPGNVRELRNVVEQTVLLASGDVVEPAQLALSAVGAREPRGEGFVLPEGGIDLHALERDLVEQALERTAGNVTDAARLLGLTRDTLRYRIEKFGLRPAD